MLNTRLKAIGILVTVLTVSAGVANFFRPQVPTHNMSICGLQLGVERAELLESWHVLEGTSDQGEILALERDDQELMVVFGKDSTQAIGLEGDSIKIDSFVVRADASKDDVRAALGPPDETAPSPLGSRYSLEIYARGASLSGREGRAVILYEGAVVRQCTLYDVATNPFDPTS